MFSNVCTRLYDITDLLRSLILVTLLHLTFHLWLKSCYSQFSNHKWNLQTFFSSTGFLPSTFTVNGSSVSFVPYIANFNSEMYPPSQFGIPSIDPRFISPPINMVRVDPSLPLVCTVCDNIDMNSSTCTYSEFINPQFFTVRALFRKFIISVICMIITNTTESNCIIICCLYKPLFRENLFPFVFF
jgi:hypothetical protein